MTLNVTVDRNQAEFEGVIVPRPSHICPSRWFDLWRSVENDYDDGWRAGWSQGYESGRDDEARGVKSG